MDKPGGRYALAISVTLSWKSGVVIFVGTILIGLLFIHFGKFALARPTIFFRDYDRHSIAMRWELRSRVWFWITMAVIVALHLALILFVPWTTKWVPAIMTIPIGIADLYVMLAILSIVGKFMERSRPSES
jgi:hypothetical protein